MSIIVGVGSPGSISSASGGKVYAYNTLSTAPQPVALPNTSRTKIIFHNPHATINIYVAPSVISNNTTGAQTAFAPTTANLGGCFIVYANGGTLEITGECQTGWQAFSASSNNIPLTVMDSNIP